METHPFVDCLKDSTLNNEKFLTVHYNEIYNDDIKSELEAIHSDRVLHKGEIYEYDTYYEKIVFIGKPEWYKEMISFPPSKEVVSIMFDWDFSNFKLGKLFSDIPSLSGKRPSFQNGIVQNTESDQLDKTDFSNAIDATIDRELIKSKLYQSDIHVQGDKKIDSLLLTLLEDEYAVLIPNTRNYEIWVLKKDPRNNEFHIVQISPKELKKGMLYMERGFSSDETKEKLSKKIFGEKYTKAVGHQKQWKELFAGKINRTSINKIVQELKSKGAITATGYNVRNWASNDVIRPSSDKDLKAILALVNMSSDFDKISISAELIKKCHKKVGFQITKILKKKIKKKLDKGNLELKNIDKPVDVYIEKEDETKMTLYPITSIHKFGNIERSLTHHVFNYLG